MRTSRAANALCWAVHHLLENPSALEKVRDEAERMEDQELTHRRSKATR